MQLQEQKENVFDENGQTITEEVTETVKDVREDGDEETVVNEGDGPGPTQDTTGVGKYRIGNRFFETQDEALAYAQSQVSALETEQQVADAYRQGLREGITQVPRHSDSVTPKPPQNDGLNTEELYTNPDAFLDKFAQRIKAETRAEFDQRDFNKQQSDQIWNEFVTRHPALADFRGEVEDFVGKNTDDVRAIISTKGRPASYDWIATKLKSRFEAYAKAVKPQRELPNGTAGASPTSRASGVTPKNPPRKPLSFAEQIRSIRKKR